MNKETANYSYEEMINRKANAIANKRIKELQVLKAKLRLEQQREKAAKAEYQLLITDSEVKHLLSLLLRKKTLLKGHYDLMEARLSANESMTNILLSELSKKYGVADPTPIIDSEEEEDEPQPSQEEEEDAYGSEPTMEDLMKSLAELSEGI